MCQWTGINVNNYYGPTIFAALGFTGEKTLMINGISGALGVVWVFIFITFIGEFMCPSAVYGTDITSRSDRPPQAAHLGRGRLRRLVGRRGHAVVGGSC